MKLKELIETYIVLCKLQKKYPTEFNIVDNFYKECNHDTLQHIKNRLYVKITNLYSEFLEEPFIINEHIVIWDEITNSIKIYPKKEIK